MAVVSLKLPFTDGVDEEDTLHQQRNLMPLRM